MQTDDISCLTSTTVALSGTWMSKEREYAGNSTWMTTDMGGGDEEAIHFWIRGGHVTIISPFVLNT